jgi:hypothetical protein
LAGSARHGTRQSADIGGFMGDTLNIDTEAAHKYFSADCFNRVWGLLDKPSRSPQEDQQMVQLCLASVWHWTERPDCTDTNMSIGYWQASRVYATIGLPDEARRYGRLCLEASKGPDILPFYLGYAYEALARAEAVAGNEAKAREHLAESHRIAERLPNPDAKKQLLADLDALAAQLLA